MADIRDHIPVCQGCGLEGGAVDGPTHPYILSSPLCWSRYTELLATGTAGQLAVDCYAIQHPGIPERRAIQSVGAHLLSLCAAFERNWPTSRASHLIQLAVENDPGWRWLDPDPPLGALTVDDVMSVVDGRSEPIERWAFDVWMEYEEHHALVRNWLDVVLGGETHRAAQLGQM